MWQEIRVRSGRDDKFIAPERLNCRSLGCARDDKREGGAAVWCDGSNDNRTDVVHSRRNLPQAGHAAPDEQKLPNRINIDFQRSFLPSTCRRQVKLLLNKQRFRSSWVPVEQTAAPTTLRSVENVSLSGHGDDNGGGPQAHDFSGRDDKFVAPERLNCRSLGYARDDKGEGGASIWCHGSNDSLTDPVHTFPNLPQASQIAPNEQEVGFRLSWVLIE